MNFKAVILLAGAALGLTSWTRAENNTFNYQGKLTDDCCPANGFYEVRFTLCQTAGGVPVPNTPVLTHLLYVTNGLFATNLNFGTGGSVFDGSARWLSLYVRTNDANAPLVALQPLTEISRTPEAVFAQKAASVASAAVTKDSIASHAVVKTLDGATDDVHLIAGDNIKVDDSDRANGNIKISSTGGVFSLSGTSAYYNKGNVGIGTSNPQAPLDVAGRVQAIVGAGPALNAIASSGNAVVGTAASGNGVQGISTSAVDSGVYGENQGQGYGVTGRTTGNGVGVYGENTSPNGWAGYFSGNIGAAGLVGIGTRSPLGKLEIQGGAAWDGTADGKAIALSYAGGGFRHFIRTRHNASDPFNNAIDFYVNKAATPAGSSAPGVGNTLALSLNGGSVGVGTTTPESKLHVNALNNGSDLWFKGLTLDGNVLAGGIFNYLAALQDSYFIRARVPRTSTTPQTVFLVRGDGNVGIGTDNPTASLDVNGSMHATGDLTLDGPEATIDFGAHEGQLLNLWGTQYGVGIQDWTMYFRCDGSGADGGFAWYAGGSHNNARLNAGDGGAKLMSLDGNGLFVEKNASVCSLTIRGGCDLAEPFQMSDREIPQGALVVIDEEHEGKLKLAEQEYDTRVAGIISGANGINPGISLHQEGTIEGGQNVALSGRVYALADASFESIKPGDLLTSSTTPGHVRKASDHNKAQGAIVGKAMSALKEGKGMVLVLVSLQ